MCLCFIPRRRCHFFGSHLLLPPPLRYIFCAFDLVLAFMFSPHERDTRNPSVPPIRLGSPFPVGFASIDRGSCYHSGRSVYLVMHISHPPAPYSFVLARHPVHAHSLVALVKGTRSYAIAFHLGDCIVLHLARTSGVSPVLLLLLRYGNVFVSATSILVQ